MMDIDSFTITSNILKILYKQECELEKSPPDCVIFHINQSNLLDIEADIIGPKATPYENGIFRVKLEIPFNFPNNPPKGYFLTKIFHPNISEKGEICVNTLKKDWNPKEWSLSNLFQVIKCLLMGGLHPRRDGLRQILASPSSVTTRKSPNKFGFSLAVPSVPN